MTQSQHTRRYQDLAGGHQEVESKLHCTLPEFLNAEIAMRVITSCQQAQHWIQSTFFWVRAFQNPSFYGLPPLYGPGWRDRLASSVRQTHLDSALIKLEEHGMLKLDSATGAIAPLEPGTCAIPICTHSIA
jgi:replicative superfamily II helicase